MRAVVAVVAVVAVGAVGAVAKLQIPDRLVPNEPGEYEPREMADAAGISGEAAREFKQLFHQLSNALGEQRISQQVNERGLGPEYDRLARAYYLGRTVPDESAYPPSSLTRMVDLSEEEKPRNPTWTDRKGSIHPLPYFIIVGAPKTGTTSLFELLGQHPDVVMPTLKEVHYFTHLNSWRGLGWYSDQFPRNLTARQITGEATPLYASESPQIAQRIFAAVPEARIILLAREPTSQIASYFSFVKRMPFLREPSETLREAVWREFSHIRLCGARSRSVFSEPCLFRPCASWHCFLQTNFYAAQLEVFLRVFAADRVYVSTYERIYGGDDLLQRAELLRLYAFLGLDTAPATGRLPHYYHQPGSVKADWPGRLRSDVKEFFRVPNRRFAAMLHGMYGWEEAELGWPSDVF